jgi:hypothetical protein
MDAEARILFKHQMMDSLNNEIPGLLVCQADIHVIT